MLETGAAYSFESSGSVFEPVTSSYSAALPLIHVLRAVFWASGLGGIAVAGVVAGALALDAQPARPKAASAPVQRSWHYIQKGTEASYVDRSSSPKIVIATDAVPEGKIVSPLPFDIALFNDPEYVRNLEQLYNPWVRY